MNTVSLLTESSWEKPADLLTSKEPGSNKGEEDDGEEEDEEEEESQEEPAAAEEESLPGEGESMDVTPASMESEVVEEVNQMPTVPKISFRVSSVCQESVRLHIPKLTVFIFRKGKLMQSPRRRRKTRKQVKMLRKRKLKRQRRRKRSIAPQLNRRRRRRRRRSPKGGELQIRMGPGSRSRRRRIPSECLEAEDADA